MPVPEPLRRYVGKGVSEGASDFNAGIWVFSPQVAVQDRRNAGNIRISARKERNQ